MPSPNPPPEQETRKSLVVREMFASIAGKYDFLNHILSGNIDRKWRQACLKAVAKRLANHHPRVLDVGCGTADLSIVFSSLGSVVGCDFCHPMLQIGMEKISGRSPWMKVAFVEGDALRLPFADRAFDAVVSAFVLRNLANINTGLREMRRVLRPGGCLGILDFALPKSRLIRGLYHVYFTVMLPRLGRWISGVNGPYAYLPESVQSFPKPEVLAKLVSQNGFSDVECHPLTVGIAFLLVGKAA